MANSITLGKRMDSNSAAISMYTKRIATPMITSISANSASSSSKSRPSSQR